VSEQPTTLHKFLEQLLLGNEIVSDGNGMIRRVKQLTLRNMVFDCNYRGNRKAINDAAIETRSVSFENVDVLRIQNCAFINSGSACLVLVKCSDAVISNNYLYDVGQGKFNADAIQVNGSFNTKVSGNLLENVGEGIYCQHHATLLPGKNVGTPDSLSEIFNNTIKTLDVGEAAAIGAYIHSSTLKKLNMQEIMLYDRGGRAIGAGIGVLSNNSKVYSNKIFKHNGIAVQAYRGHGNLGTSKVEVRNNIIKENAKIKYFSCEQGRYIRNSNGALVVSAAGQTVTNVTFLKNQVYTSYNSGVDMVVVSDNQAGILDNIRIDSNIFSNTCNDTMIDKAAAIDFRNVGFTNPDNKNLFRNIEIKGNQLGYGYKGNGLWLEPCMSNVRILQNTFLGDPAFKFNAATGSCIREIAPVNVFSLAQRNTLQCFLESGAPPIGTCTTIKCIKCE
jgi:hypothetical protein